MGRRRGEGDACRSAPRKARTHSLQTGPRSAARPGSATRRWHLPSSYAKSVARQRRRKYRQHSRKRLVCQLMAPAAVRGQFLLLVRDCHIHLLEIYLPRCKIQFLNVTETYLRGAASECLLGQGSERTPPPASAAPQLSEVSEMLLCFHDPHTVTPTQGGMT